MVFLTRTLRANEAFRKWYHGISLYNRYGLYADDVLDDEHNEEVREAVRRLPAEEYDRRMFRHVRAFQLEITKSYLPKDEWINYEDQYNYYLQPYIKEVLAELKEKSDWVKAHPQ
ncbi:Cytochrome b-c1 complex subunit 7 [Halotydeus destructor]|nr:Cytochrome b-c1 complex subunit 7 [Halotydeus destructor]